MILTVPACRGVSWFLKTSVEYHHVVLAEGRGRHGQIAICIVNLRWPTIIHGQVAWIKWSCPCVPPTDQPETHQTDKYQVTRSERPRKPKLKTTGNGGGFTRSPYSWALLSINSPQMRWRAWLSETMVAQNHLPIPA